MVTPSALSALLAIWRFAVYFMHSFIHFIQSQLLMKEIKKEETGTKETLLNMQNIRTHR